MNAHELAERMLAAKSDADEAIAALESAALEAQEAERRYRLARATAILSTAGTVQEREARMDKATSDERFAAKLADDVKVAALERVRLTRQWLSNLQTLAAADRAEAELARWEPREVSA
ncbi:MAG TPA: hypothetical protein VFT76_00120 [Actinomycetota bacterium]|nr:hypothetical protein [Actinomycetota bacterium]